MYFHSFLALILFSKCKAEDELKPSLDDLFTSPLTEGKKFSITCQLNNGKQPTHVSFEWFIHGKRIEQDENVTINQVDDASLLSIRSMSSNYNGEYTCRSRNGHMQDAKSISIKLNGTNFSQLNRLPEHLDGH